MFRKSVFIMLFVCLLASCQIAWAAWPWDGQQEWQPAASSPDWCNSANWHQEGSWPVEPTGPNNQTYLAVLPNQPGPRIGLGGCVNATASMLSLNPWSPDSWGGQDVNITMLDTAADCNFNCAIQIASQADYDSKMGGGTLLQRAIINQYGGTVYTPTPGGMTGFYGLTVGGGGTTLGDSYGMYNLYGGLASFPRIRLYFGELNVYGGTMEATDGNFVFTQNHSENKINVNGGTLRIAGNWMTSDPNFPGLIANKRLVCRRGGDLGNPYTMVDGGGNTWTVITGTKNFNNAWNPLPEMNDVNVHYYNGSDTNSITLTWNRGEPNAIQHDVYFGTSFSDVDSATTASSQFQHSFLDANNGDPCSWAISGYNFLQNATYYWRVDENSVTSDSPKTYLMTKGRVWKFTTHDGRASNPRPRDTQYGLSEPLQLSWTGGDFTQPTGHRVFFGTNSSAVLSAPISTSSADIRYTTNVQYRGTVNAPAYPLTRLTELVNGTTWSLIPGKTYYWRIDEVNNVTAGSTVVGGKGPVWSFTYAPFITIEDFEDYNNTADINAVWTIGKTITCPDSSLPRNMRGVLTYAIDATAGKHGMFHYDNTTSNNPFSEVNRPYSGGTLFTSTSGVFSTPPVALRVDYLGAALNSAVPIYDRMYVALEDTAGHVGVYSNSDGATQQTTWQQWYIPLNDANFTSVNKAAVSGFMLGVGLRCTTDSYGATGDGNLMFDNIRLYAQTCNPNPPFDLTADMDRDCDIDVCDLDVFANDWLKKADVYTFDITAPQAPVLWYKFDETDDTTTCADSGKTGSYTGAINNMIPANWNPNGRHNGCLYLPSGSQSNVGIDVASLSFMGDANHSGPDGGGITFATWINADVMAADFKGWIYGFIVVKDANGNDAIEIACPHHHDNSDWSADNCWAGWTKNGTPGFSFGPSMPVANYGGRWNHWAFVKAPHTVSWYCNGYLIRQEADTDANAGDLSIYGPLFPLPVSAFTIGLGGWGGNWAGYIDDFQVYDYALSAAEIDYLATDGTGSLLLPLVSNANLNLSGGTAGDANQIVNFEDLSVMGDQWHQLKLWP